MVNILQQLGLGGAKVSAQQNFSFLLKWPSFVGRKSFCHVVSNLQDGQGLGSVTQPFLHSSMPSGQSFLPTISL